MEKEAIRALFVLMEKEARESSQLFRRILIFRLRRPKLIGIQNLSTFSIRIELNSSIDGVTQELCGKWPELGLRCFNMYFSRDVKNNLIQSDGELHSLACYCFAKKILIMEINLVLCVSLLITSSYASYASSSSCGGGGLFPLAVGVVNIENESNWLWFLEIFKKAFGYERRYTFMSDRHHGLLVNIPLVFPGSYHSFICLWHMENGLRIALSKTCGLTKVLVALFKKCAYATTHEVFEERIAELLNIGGDAVSNFLSRAPYENWANAYFRGARYSEMCFSLVECFNNWIDKEHYLPITAVLDEILIKMINMAFKRRKECKN
ncbi:hypothetical protein IFM89_037496 [Coptis chinensis]|uniref:MULE transposase domain-containing protein n=1 Tax=Coptis chinensis TaxID=261450 RepID=A0A835LXM1_9MAGN|nr:hypothetical protein IFM89_037496 [Coptis chinensis]